MKRSTSAKALLGILAIGVGARLVDVALVGAAIATAAGSVVFAGAMLLRSDHAPGVNGIEYLAIFGRPRGAAKPPADESPTDAPRATELADAGIDPAPIGSIAVAPPSGAAPIGSTDPAATLAVAPYSLVAAEFGFAWVREGTRIFAVRPGDTVPRLGRVNAILMRNGRWTVVGDADVALLSSGDPAPAPETASRAPFARDMIFGPNK